MCISYVSIYVKCMREEIKGQGSPFSSMRYYSTAGLRTLLTCPANDKLASCPWGPVTANGVDTLTEMYVIYSLGAAGLH